jgi:hypothetical protein
MINFQYIHTPGTFSPKRGGVIAALRENGVAFAMLYGAFWCVPLAGAFCICSAGDNFGIDPIATIESLHTQFNFPSPLQSFGLQPDVKLAPWQVSALLAYLFNSFVELVRLPAAIALAPKLKRMLAHAK